ncbi:hypothetical protein B5M57_04075 [Bacillus velezensis]|nr:hypothetical protein B5M57_04075 [Bacillus velezensis]
MYSINFHYVILQSIISISRYFIYTIYVIRIVKSTHLLHRRSADCRSQNNELLILKKPLMFAFKTVFFPSQKHKPLSFRQNTKIRKFILFVFQQLGFTIWKIVFSA